MPATQAGEKSQEAIKEKDIHSWLQVRGQLEASVVLDLCASAMLLGQRHAAESLGVAAGDA